MNIEPLEVVWPKQYDEIHYLKSLRVKQLCNGHEKCSRIAGDGIVTSMKNGCRPRGRGDLGKQSMVRLNILDI